MARVLQGPAGLGRDERRRAARRPAVSPPPYRIETERLVIRCWEPADAPWLLEALEASVEHLRPWMPWAHDEPSQLAAVAARLRSFRGRFDLDEEYVYGVFAPRGGEVVGGAGLHPRSGPGSLEVGYWIRPERLRQGLATEAAAALTQAAFRVCQVERVEIHVDPENTASLGVPAKLGFRREATLRRRQPPIPPSSVRRDEVVFTMLQEEYAGTPAAAVRMRGFDAAGARVL
jgi:RimJ/RimL family protein N-acetyltransferase